MGVNRKNGLERRDWVSMCMQGEREPEAARRMGGKEGKASACCGKGAHCGTFAGRATVTEVGMGVQRTVGIRGLTLCDIH